MHRSQVALYSASFPAPFSVVAKVAYLGDDWTLDGSDEQELFLTIPDRDHPGARIRIGELQLLEGKEGQDPKVDGPRLVLSLDPQIPQEIAKQVGGVGTDRSRVREVPDT